MHLKLIAFVAAAALVPVAIALIVVVTWTPATHPIRTPGAKAVPAHFAPGSVELRDLVPRPTTSLDQVRCEAWKTLSSQPCDAARLAQQMWPGLSQNPKTLYVALSNGMPASASAEGTNVEYDPASQTLTIHTFWAQPLFVPRTRDDTSGAALRAAIVLLLVETNGIPAGDITVYQDGWLERLTGDVSAGESNLGTVAVS